MSQADIQSIIFEGDGRAEIFSFRPEHVEKEKRGNLFLVGKTIKRLSRQDASFYILNSVAAILKKEYYSPSYPHPIGSFEGALKKANSFLTSVKPEVAQSLEMVALTLTGSHVTFSSLGKPEVLLLRNERLFRLTKTRQKEKKLFLHVTKGRVKHRDKLIISTSDLTYWLGTPLFASRLINRSLERIREHLYIERKEIRDTKSFALLYLTIVESLEPSVINQEEGSLLEVVRAPRAKPVPVSSPTPALLPHFTPISSPHNALTSLKRYYLHYWHGKQSATALREFLQKNLTLIKNKFPFLQRTYSINTGRSFASPVKLGIGAVIIIGILWISASLFAPKSIAVKEGSGTGALAKQEGLLFQFPQNTQINSAYLASPTSYIITQGRLFLVNPDNKKMDSFLSLEGDVKGFTNANNTLYILEKLGGNQWQIVIVDPTGRSVHKESLIWPLQTDLVKDFRYYEGSLYALEGFSGQIVKYRLSQFTKPSLWISSKSLNQIKNPISFAIDGSLYLLQEGVSSILQFYAGQLARTIPLPPGIQANMIITSSDLKNMYLFNTIKGEVAIVDKKSQLLLKTFSHASLMGVKDVHIDEAAQSFWLINGSGIFTVSMEQKNKAL